MSRDRTGLYGKSLSHLQFLPGSYNEERRVEPPIELVTPAESLMHTT